MKRIMRVLPLAVLALSVTGCEGILSALIGGKTIDQVTNSVDQAVAIIDKGISDITMQSTSWRNVLQQVAQDLPVQIDQTLRNDAQNLATRSISTAGIEMRCNVDFLANRAIMGLKALRAKLLKQPPAPVPPQFCQVAPNAIELSANPASWSRITLDGYDLDQADATGHPLRVMLLDANGAQREFPEARIGRTTHYQVTLNLGGLERDIYQSHITKVVVSWSGSTRGYPEVVVVPWGPQTRVQSVPPSDLSYMPPKIGRGDADFNTHDDEPMSVDVRAEVSVSPNQLQGRVYLHAKEERSDWTEVGGWSNYTTLYTAPLGWKILSVTPTAASRYTGYISDHSVHTYNAPSGTVATQFTVWGDRSGDDAASYTRMSAHWNGFQVVLQQTAPVWALDTP